ncbi:MAG: peptidoglycan-binding protein LysM [Rhodobiaceae bacterium]|nr:MAG: peptidoglycan-binding protein LysM [Rhodobiaceae bacterium]
MSPRIALIAGGIIAVIIAVIVAFFLFSGDDEAGSVAVTSPGEPGRPGTSIEEVVEQIVPTFDIVRVERDGMAVIAGRAAPGSDVSLKRNGSTVAATRADGRGEWVIVLDEPLAPGDIQLSLTARNPVGGTVDSVQSVSISVPDQAGGQALVVLAEPGRASRVLQGPGVPSDAGNLVLEAVDYDENGNVIISGIADPGATIQIYLNDSSIGSSVAGPDGHWELHPGGAVAPGVYAMRIDQLDAGGKVVARVEVPFERVVADEVRRQLAEGQVVIQPGNNLWNIARQLYGTGYRYTVIYQANRDQIRDPNLIYPGQILVTPK